MSLYAQDTSTSVEKTRAELETVLGKFGADAFGYMTEGGRSMIQFKVSGKFVRFILPLPNPKEQRFTHYRHRNKHMVARNADASRKEWEQACRSAWRALFMAVKAKLVAVDAKISTVEHEFLAQIIMPNGRTIAEEIIPMVEDAYRTGQMPTFTLALPAPETHAPGNGTDL